MNIENQIICILLAFFLSFCYLRSLFAGIIDCQLSNKSYKKRMKNSTLKDRLLYSKFRIEIPKFFFYFYMLIITIHIIILLLCLLQYFAKKIIVPGIIIIKSLGIFDAIWILLLALIFWSPRNGYSFKRWIVPNKKNKK